MTIIGPPAIFDQSCTVRVVTPVREVVARALTLQIVKDELIVRIDTGDSVVWVQSRPGDEPLAEDDDRVQAYAWSVSV